MNQNHITLYYSMRNSIKEMVNDGEVSPVTHQKVHQCQFVMCYISSISVQANHPSIRGSCRSLHSLSEDLA